MLVKFKDGTKLKCTCPAEQKIFKNGEAAGWLCAFTLSGVISSSEIDTLVTPDNISELVFCDGNEKELFSIGGYAKVSSVVVRYSETSGSAEIQLSKGV